MILQPPWCTWIGLHVQFFRQFTPIFESFRPELKVAFLGFLAKVAFAEFTWELFAFCKIGNESEVWD
jgi:hypothetical protein